MHADANCVLSDATNHCSLRPKFPLYACLPVVLPNLGILLEKFLLLIIPTRLIPSRQLRLGNLEVRGVCHVYYKLSHHKQCLETSQAAGGWSGYHVGEANLGVLLEERLSVCVPHGDLTLSRRRVKGMPLLQKHHPATCSVGGALCQ